MFQDSRIETRRASLQHCLINTFLRGSPRTIIHTVELKTVVSDEDEINSCIQRLNDSIAYAVLIDRTSPICPG
jgi:hypothetical protein